jgi:hypothetical protein
VITAYIGSSAVAVRQSDASGGESFPGLVNGKRYTFKVVAINARGASQESAFSPPVIVGTPDPPTRVFAVAAKRSATVQWFAPFSNHGAKILDLVVIADRQGVVECRTTVPPVFVDEYRQEGAVKGLNPGRYTFKVAARNSRGLGKPSAMSRRTITVKKRERATRVRSRSRVSLAAGSGRWPGL